MQRSSRPVLMGLLLFALSCTPVPRTTVPPPSPSPTPTPSPQADAGGGFDSPEPGETAPDRFEGTAGITEEKRDLIEVATLKAVRTGRHPNFERVVFEFEGERIPGYHIEYIDKPVRDCGAGNVIPVRGDGFLRVQMMPARAHTEEGQPTIEERSLSPNLPVLKDLKLICDFEAVVQWVLGVSSPNPYRVIELSNPARLVVDVRTGSSK